MAYKNIFLKKLYILNVFISGKIKNILNMFLARIKSFFSYKVPKEFKLFPKSRYPLSFQPLMLAQGIAVVIFIIALLSCFLPQPKLDESLLVRATNIKQTSAIVAGQPVHWTVLVNKSDIKEDSHLIKLPRSAKSIKISTVTSAQADSVLKASIPKPETQISLKQKKLLANENQPKSFLMASLFSSFGKYFLSSLADGVDNIVEQVTQPEIQTINDSKVVDISNQAPETPAPTEQVQSPEVQIPTEQSPAPETPATSSTDISETTTPSDQSIINTPSITEETTPSGSLIETTTSANEPLIKPDQKTDDVVKIDYETPAPQITEEITDTGKQVTVSAPSETPDQPQLTDIVAFTNIPKMFKVGQENKIKIKWKNNGNQDVTFHAYDTNNDGYLDYVEWTVPHLSDQIFEIIFISKAFQLDSDRNILSDIYPAVQSQDGSYVSLTDGQYIRVTFDQILDSSNDNTIYAKPTKLGQPATIEVYPVYTDEDGNQTDGQKVATFQTIDHESLYKVLLTNLQTPTDTFDLKINGNVDIDYIVDPSIETLYPNAAGDLTDVPTEIPGTGSNWDKVAEVSPDDDTTYVENTSGLINYKEDLYNLSDHSVGTGVISSVVVYARLKSFNATGCAIINLKTNSTDYALFNSCNIWTNWTNYNSGTLVVNPFTGNAWTWAEIDALQAGVSLWGSSGSSLLPGQKVLMSDKTQKNIEDIKVGDEIISYNQSLNKTEKDKVIKVQGGSHPDYLIFNGTLKTSLDHVIFTSNGFKPAQDIKIGDFLLNPKGEKVKITKINHIYNKVKTYDLVVEKNHNFFAENYLVHNSSPKYAAATQIYVQVSYTPYVAPANKYWVGGTGNWSDATHHWALSSNGSPGVGNLPIAGDSIVFDSNSGGGVATIDAIPPTLNNFTLDTNNTTTVTAQSPVTLTGNLTVTAGTLNGDGDFTVGGGSVTGDGTIIMSNGTFTLFGTGNFGGATNWTFNNLTFGDGTTSATTSKTGANMITANTNLKISTNHTLAMGTSTWNLSWGGGGFLGNIKQVVSAPGSNLTAALKADGSRIYVFGGDNSYGVFGINSTTPFQNYAITTVLGLGGVGFLGDGINGGPISQIVMGPNTVYALKSDGSRVYAWGMSNTGQLGNNTTPSSSTIPVTVLGVGGNGFLGDGINGGPISQIAAGGSPSSTGTAYALKSDGSAVYAWGNNTQGECGINNTTTPQKVPVQVLGVGASGVLGDANNGYPITQITAGQQFAVALGGAGAKVYAWGLNSLGQCGINNITTPQKTPVQVLGVGASGTLGDANNGNPITQIAAGSNHVLALGGAGAKVYAWGQNTTGQCGINNTTSPQKTPVQVLGVGNAGTLGDGTHGGPISQIAAGSNYSLALKSDGSAMYAWGSNASGQLGNNTTTSSNVPVQVVGIGGTGTFGDGTNGGPISQISAGLMHPLALKSDGSRVYAWGYGGSDQLGIPNEIWGLPSAINTPIQVPGIQTQGSVALTDIKQIVSGSTGYRFMLALKADGSRVYAWGDNTMGELGNNSIINSNSGTPVAVVGVGGTGYLGDGVNGGPISQLAAGYNYAMALKSDGTEVYAWGGNDQYQLGQNNSTTYKTPVKVLGVGGTGFLGDGINGGPISQIAAGYYFSTALKSDGSAVYTWGNNDKCQLGVTTTPNFKVPNIVKGPSGSGTMGDSVDNGYPITQIAAGSQFVLALGKSGTAVYAWGQNSAGQHGNNATTYTCGVIDQVLGVGGTGFMGDVNNGPISQISGGLNTAYALKSDGSRVYAWGANDSYQCGINNTTTPQKIPVMVYGRTGVGSYLGDVNNGPISQISAGYTFALALKSDGTRVYGWGSDTKGQCGDNNANGPNAPIPAKVIGYGGTGYLGDRVNGGPISQVSAGYNNSYFLQSDGSKIYDLGDNQNGQLADNNLSSEMSKGTLNQFAQVLTQKPLTVQGAITPQTSTLQLSGNFTPSVLVGTTTTSTPVLGYTEIPAGTYNDLQFNNSAETYITSGTVNARNLTITSGTLDAGATAPTLGVSGNWSNSGTFSPRWGTVVFAGPTQSITGANTFYNFTIQGPNTVTFPSGITQTFNSGGTFASAGTIGYPITINSSTPGIAATLSKPANGTVGCARTSFQDSTATGGAIWRAGITSTSVSGNSGWIFSPTLISISASPSVVKGGSQITITPSGQGDPTSQTLYYYCSSAPGAKSSNTKCSQGNTGYASPYSSVNCTYNVTPEDATKTIRCVTNNGTYDSPELTTTYIVDSTAPVATDNVPSTWQTSNITVTLSCTDTNGCSKVYYTIDGSTPTTSSSYVDASSSWGFIYSAEASSTLKYFGVDSVGNQEGVVTASNLLRLDKTAPVATDNVPSTWQTSNITVTLSCTDTNGCSKVYYTIDGSTPTTSSSYVDVSSSWQFIYSTETTSTLKYKGEDTVGNLEDPVTATNLLRLDKTAPSITINQPDTSNAHSKIITASASDGTLTMSNTTGSTCNGSLTFIPYASQTITSESNNGKRVCYKAVDSVGNIAYSLSDPISGIIGCISSDDCRFGFVCAYNACVRATTGNPNSGNTPNGGNSYNNSTTTATSTPTTTSQPVTNIVQQVGQQINNAVQQVQNIANIFNPNPENVVTVPQEAPLALQGLKIMSVNPLSEFNLITLGTHIGFFTEKLPQFAKTLDSLGVNISNASDVKKLSQTELYLPGLTETVLSKAEILNANKFTNIDKTPIAEVNPKLNGNQKGSLNPVSLQINPFASVQGVPLADLSPASLSKIPSDIVFASTSRELINFSTALNVDNNGVTEQQIKTVSGKPIELVIKPNNPASSVIGLITVKKLQNANIDQTNKNVFEKLFDAALSAVITAPEVQSQTANNMLVQKFEYSEVKPGIFKAEINSPEAEGQYDIVTVVAYQNNSLTPTESHLTAVVDPEGYVYKQTSDGKLRIENVKVSIYWLNTDTNRYELWPADKFFQKNPITTDDTGKYSFLVPQGKYYLTATADGYNDFKGSPFTVQEDNSVKIDIELKAKISWANLFNWNNVITVLLLIILALFCIFVLPTYIKGRKN